jgi:hypothetical protein
MKIQTKELTGAALDWAVAQCEEDRLGVSYLTPRAKAGLDSPSTDWAQGGPIIERERISVDTAPLHDGWIAVTSVGCYALPNGRHYADGSTPLIAAMRCYVASKLGDEVDVPHELAH